LRDILKRIEEALEQADKIARNYAPGLVEFEYKKGDDPITKADLEIDEILKRMLPRNDEAWLSEETADSPERLNSSKIWIVDPLDGTREFVEGVPEWCISIGYVVDGIAVAGGITNPETNETIIGAVGEGIYLNGERCESSSKSSLDRATVLASNSEIRRGEWDKFANAGMVVKPCGSVAYKLGLVAAGIADATWTLVPKNEWDVAGGVALLNAGGGFSLRKDGRSVLFNQSASTLLPGLIACGSELKSDVLELLGIIEFN